MIAKKASVIALSTSLVGLAALWGAAPAEASSHVTITFMEAMSSGTLAPALKALVAQFERTHPNITVELLPEPSYSVLEAKIEASVAAGQAPTIAQAYEDWAAGYVQSHAIVPLTSYVNGKNGLTAAEKRDFWPTIWKDQFINGTMYMFPFNKSDFVMYYNENWLKADHLPVPATWAQFAQDAKAVTNPKKDTWGISIDPGSSSGAANGTYLFVALIRAYGGGLLTGKNQPNFDSKAARQALQYLVNLYKAGYLKLGTNYPGQTALGSEHSPFDLSTIASYYYNEEDIGNKFTLGVAPFPKGPKGEGNVLQGTNIVMFQSATTAQKNAAWTFMKWLAEPKQTAYWAEHTGYLPVVKSAINLMKGYYNTHPYQKIAAESLQYAWEVPPLPGFDQAIGALANAIQEATVGHESVAQALKQAQLQAQQDLYNQ
ncbi:MAG: ABC transporter substrate-binding protein [Firmicutes bacterium]|nr:ABC transporter substrate-binding protein [Bacillota bacterium]